MNKITYALLLLLTLFVGCVGQRPSPRENALIQSYAWNGVVYNDDAEKKLEDSLLLSPIKFGASTTTSTDVDDSLSDGPHLGSIWMIDPKTPRNPIESIHPMPAVRIDQDVTMSFYVTLVEVTTGRTLRFHDPEVVVLPRLLRQLLSSCWFRLSEPDEIGQPYIIRGINDKGRLIYYKEWYEPSQSVGKDKQVEPVKKVPKQSDGIEPALQNDIGNRPSLKGGGLAFYSAKTPAGRMARQEC